MKTGPSLSGGDVTSAQQKSDVERGMSYGQAVGTFFTAVDLLSTETQTSLLFESGGQVNPDCASSFRAN